ncbi:MAG: aspartate kinase [Acetivibrionales bacterium]
MKVAKFGGTSLANAEQIKKVCNIILSDPERQIIVVSAPGKRSKDDIKVTDMLIDLAESFLRNGYADKQLEVVVSRYAEIACGLGLSDKIVKDIETDLKERLKIDKSNTDEFMDSIKAAGEDNCARLINCYLTNLGKQSKYINPKDAGLLLSNEYGNARVLPESYKNLKSLKDIPGIKIFPGFFGYSSNGEIVTFSRGGSDVTGSILAAAVDADLYENFTDVDNVYSVNPEIVPKPQPIYKLTYREMRELSYAGFNIFHEEALVSVYRKGIPVRIKNTNNPDAPGTTIVPELKKITRPVVGIASGKGFCNLYIRKYLMNREIGFGRRVLEILEDEGIPYEHMPSGIDDISVVISEKHFDTEMEEAVVHRVKTELDVDDIKVERNKALIMVVGEGCTNTIGIAARATGAFTRARVNIEMINQGSSEVSIMFGIKAEDSDRAVRSLYKEFFENNGK